MSGIVRSGALRTLTLSIPPLALRPVCGSNGKPPCGWRKARPRCRRACRTCVPASGVTAPSASTRQRSRNIESIRPFFHSPQGTRVVSFFPAFLPITTVPDPTPQSKCQNGASVYHHLALTGHQYRSFAPSSLRMRPSAGILPLILPDRARLILRYSGDISAVNGVVQWLLLRIRHQVPTAANAGRSLIS